MIDFDSTKKQREEFITFWANYVRTHSDQTWSHQQNILINSALQAARKTTKKEYLAFKKEKKRK